MNTVTGDIDYDGERFVTKDLEKLENISMHIEKLAEVYEIEPPKPPHTNEKGKKLLSVDMRAYYVKIDGAVYGVLGIIWEYCKIGHKNIR